MDPAGQATVPSFPQWMASPEILRIAPLAHIVDVDGEDHVDDSGDDDAAHAAT